MRIPSLMKLHFCVLLLAGLVCAKLEGQEPVRPALYPPEKTYAPSPVPDRIVLTWSEDPSTTQSVTWRTDTSVEKGLVEYAVAEKGPQFVRQLKRIGSTMQKLKTNLGEAHYHTAIIKELDPESKYLYRVGDGTNWSEWSLFETASQKEKPFSFIYFGDAQNSIKSHWSRLIREAFKEAPRARFMLHCGDLVNRPNNDFEWSEWFYSGGWINRTLPSLATPGNHEYSRGKLSMQWRPVFDFPKNGPQSLSETVYYFDYQGVRIISLNSNENLDEQVKWFHQVMKENTNRWTLVAMHHPVYSTAPNRNNPGLRKKLKPLFDQYKIDMVLQGHDHAYGRTGLVGADHPHDTSESGAPQTTSGGEQTEEARNVATGLATRSDASGTVYVVSVSGPKMYGTKDDPIFKKMAKNTQLFQVIHIDKDKLTYSAYTALGDLFDRIELHKRKDKPNRLVEVAVKNANESK